MVDALRYNAPFSARQHYILPPTGSKTKPAPRLPSLTASHAVLTVAPGQWSTTGRHFFYVYGFPATTHGTAQYLHVHDSLRRRYPLANKVYVQPGTPRGYVRFDSAGSMATELDRAGGTWRLPCDGRWWEVTAARELRDVGEVT
ncbi:hypothetical protein HKX48_004544, partial [Thoreauomyces humboldtii]